WPGGEPMAGSADDGCRGERNGRGAMLVSPSSTRSQGQLLRLSQTFRRRRRGRVAANAVLGEAAGMDSHAAALKRRRSRTAADLDRHPKVIVQSNSVVTRKVEELGHVKRAQAETQKATR